MAVRIRHVRRYFCAWCGSAAPIRVVLAECGALINLEWSLTVEELLVLCNSFAHYVCEVSWPGMKARGLSFSAIKARLKQGPDLLPLAHKLRPGHFYCICPVRQERAAAAGSGVDYLSYSLQALPGRLQKSGGKSGSGDEYEEEPFKAPSSVPSSGPLKSAGNYRRLQNQPLLRSGSVSPVVEWLVG